MEWISEIRRLPARASWELLERVREEAERIIERHMEDRGLRSINPAHVSVFTDLHLGGLWIEVLVPAEPVTDEAVKNIEIPQRVEIPWVDASWGPYQPPVVGPTKQTSPGQVRVRFDAETQTFEVAAEAQQPEDVEPEDLLADELERLRAVALKAVEDSKKLADEELRREFDRAMALVMSADRASAADAEKELERVMDKYRARRRHRDPNDEHEKVIQSLTNETPEARVTQAEPHAPRRGIQIWSATPLSDEEVLGAAEQMDRAGANVWDEGDADDVAAETLGGGISTDAIQRLLESQKSTVTELSRELRAAEEKLHHTAKSLRVALSRENQYKNLEED